jgi:flagellar biosynthesis regulator FlbT
MDIETCLGKLIKYLEQLTKSPIDNKNDIIEKFKEYYSICDNELQKMMYNDKIITNNQNIDKLLNNVKIYRVLTNIFIIYLIQPKIFLKEYTNIIYNY